MSADWLIDWLEGPWVRRHRNLGFIMALCFGFALLCVIPLKVLEWRIGRWWNA